MQHSNFEQPHLTPPSSNGSAFSPRLLFVLLAGGLVTGSILQQQKLDYCPNDASRWNTIYYLTEHGTYEYLPDYKVWWMGGRGKTIEQLTPEQRQTAEMPSEKKDSWIKIGERYYLKPWEMPPFWTIDMIRVVGEDGRDHYYSSKPPLHPTLVAGVVWVLEKLTLGHAEFSRTPWFMIRTTLVITQVIPLMVMIWLLGGHIRRFSDLPFVQSLCLAGVALGTYVTPYAVTLNNHVPGAVCAMIALHAFVRIWYDGRREWYWFALAGFFAAFVVTFELPAAALATGVIAALLYCSPRKTLLAAAPAAAIPLAAMFLTNYLAVGRPNPAYADFGVAGGFYDYPGSYWRHPTGLDALAESWPVYLAHLVIGHRGFFFLTPIFVISLIGIVGHLRRSDAPFRLLAAFVPLMSAIVIGFYTVKSNNYGGGAQGARWLFWMAPLWLFFLPAGALMLSATRERRAFCYLCLAISVITASFALRMPWGDSWAHLLFRQLGIIKY